MSLSRPEYGLERAERSGFRCSATIGLFGALGAVGRPNPPDSTVERRRPVWDRRAERPERDGTPAGGPQPGA